MGKMLWHVTVSMDGFVVSPDAAMDGVFEHPQPNAGVGKVIETTGPVLEGYPDACHRSWRLNTGLTDRYWREIASDIGAYR